MPSHEVFSKIAFVTSLLGFSYYGFLIISGRVKPKILTWFIWAILDTILYFGMLAKHAMNLQMEVVIRAVWVIVLLSFWKGIREWSKIDTVCLIGSIASLGSWYLTKNPTVGIVVVLLVNWIGTIPAVVSVWEDPSRECWKGWAMGFISPICTFFAIPEGKIGIDTASQPIVFASITGTMILLSLRKKDKLYPEI